MSWDRPQKAGVARGRRADFEEAHIVPSLYRPFTKQWLYFDAFFNNCVYQMPRLFPRAGAENRAICTTGKGEGGGAADAVCCCPSAVSPNAVVKCHESSINIGCGPYELNHTGPCTLPSPPPGKCLGSVAGSGAGGVDAVAVLVPLLALAALRVRRRRFARGSGPGVQGGKPAST